ncbi:YjgN family protein [Hydrogenophaga soli]
MTITNLATLPPESADIKAAQIIPLEFTGSGSEYFRIWIVNTLLAALTLGLYLPWARVRKLRYVYGNTLVDGEPLDFHGDPRKMFRGHVLVSGLFLAYLMAGNASPLAEMVAALLLGGLWPWLVNLSMRFRLHHTSWRGLRFAFTGRTADAYAAFGSLTVWGVLSLGIVVYVEADREMAGWAPRVSLCVLGVGALLFPWLWHRIKTYQQGHCAYGTLKLRFKGTVGAFYGVALKAAGIALAGLLLAALVFWLELRLSTGQTTTEKLFSKEGPAVGLVLRLMLEVMVITGGCYLWSLAFYRAAMQNLVWSHTGNQLLRFKSRLRVADVMKLTLKNTLLLGLTLGLYWPFAYIAMTRLRLQAVRVHTRYPLDMLQAEVQATTNETAGDAAGELLGADLGL